MQLPRNILTIAEIKKHFTYCKATGDLLWNYSKEAGRATKNAIAGTLSKDQYKAVKVDGKRYKVHRLVWILHGGDPYAVITFKDEDIRNSRIENMADTAGKRPKKRERKHGFIQFSNGLRLIT